MKVCFKHGAMNDKYFAKSKTVAKGNECPTHPPPTPVNTHVGSYATEELQTQIAYDFINLTRLRKLQFFLFSWSGIVTNTEVLNNLDMHTQSYIVQGSHQIVENVKMVVHISL